jgi:serine/threonine-protein kinase
VTRDTLETLRRAIGDRYAIEREVGRGGMAAVYRAHDRKHARPVALKVLLPEVAALVGTERFLREIETAARLNHPHVLPLHDSGEAEGLLYFVMPFMEGETLRARLEREGRLPLADALGIAAEVGGALEYAHQRGVVHRDIKPENILLEAGHAIVADFGIAHAVGAADLRITRPGAPLGTPLYMSPEQAEGEGAVDARTDVYGLGCLVFEMLAGRPPFVGPTAEHVVSQHLTDEPPPLRALRPEVPEAVETAVVRALRKAPADRFPSARDFAAALREGGRRRSSDAASRAGRRRMLVLLGVATAAVVGAIVLRGMGEASALPRIEALAVLPLEDLAPEPGQEYFADGMTEALITNLAGLRALKVISRTSVMRYKGTQRPLREVARELGVDAVLEGTVLRVGSRVRISAQLVHAASDRHLWAEAYERELTDVLSLQRDVARAVAGEIRVVLSPEERRRLGERRPVDPAAYEAYLRGRFHWNKRTPEGFEAAIREFRRAVELDPTYALPYSGLADSYILLVEWRRLAAPDGVPLARAAALQALALDSTLAEAHTSLGEVRVIAWDWEGAERAFRRARALNPGYATAHQWYGFFLSKMGRHEEAIAELERAVELDPLSLIIRTEFGRVYFHARRYADVLRTTARARELDSTFADADYVRALALAEDPARREEAMALFRRVAPVLPTTADLARTLAVAGRRREARAMLDSVIAVYQRGDPNPRYADVAMVYGALGEIDRAFEWLERAYARGVDDQLTYLKVHPGLEPLRGDPRFADLLRRMRFPIP